MGCGSSKKAAKVDEKAHEKPQSADRVPAGNTPEPHGSAGDKDVSRPPTSQDDRAANPKLTEIKNVDRARLNSNGSVDDEYLLVLEEMDRIEGGGAEPTPSDKRDSHTEAAQTAASRTPASSKPSKPRAVDQWSTYQENVALPLPPTPKSSVPIAAASALPSGPPPQLPPKQQVPVVSAAGGVAAAVTASGRTPKTGKGKLFDWIKTWKGRICNKPAARDGQRDQQTAAVELQQFISLAQGSIGMDECLAVVDAVNQALHLVLGDALARTEHDANDSHLMGTFGIRQIRGLFDMFVRHSTGAGHTPAAIAYAVHSAVDCMSHIAHACPDVDTGLDSLNRLVLLLLPGLEGDINELVSPEEADNRRQTCVEKFGELGIRQSIIAQPVWMSPRTKALFLYCDLCSHGQKRLTLPVSRGFVARDAKKIVNREQGKLAGDSTFKIFPYYKNPDGSVEAGEGHGPRKEFFTLLSDEFSATWGPRQARDAVVKAQAGASVLTPVSGDTQGIVAGMRLTLTSSTDTTGFELSRTVVEVDADHIRVDQIFEQEVISVPGSLYVQDKTKPLFEFNSSAGCHWYGHVSAAKTRVTAQMFEFAGWVCGMSITNRVPLELRLPPALFHGVLDPSWGPSAEDLIEYDPEMQATIKNVRGLKGAALQGMLEMEELDTSWTAEQYINHLARQTLVDSVQWQREALRTGFQSAVPSHLLAAYRLTGHDLAEMISAAVDDPESDFSFKDYFRIIHDDEFDEFPHLTESLWSIVDNMSPVDKRAFLKFVTGRDRLPLPYAEPFRVEIPFAPISRQDHEEMLGTLPQSHTCSNTLELPNYWQAYQETAPDMSDDEITRRTHAKLTEKLLMAIHGAHGYDLDDGAAERGQRAVQEQHSNTTSLTMAPLPSPSPSVGSRADSRLQVPPSVTPDMGVMSFGDSMDFGGAATPDLPDPPKRGMKMNTSSFSVLPSIHDQDSVQSRSRNGSRNSAEASPGHRPQHLSPSPSMTGMGGRNNAPLPLSPSPSMTGITPVKTMSPSPSFRREAPPAPLVPAGPRSPAISPGPSPTAARSMHKSPSFARDHSPLPVHPAVLKATGRVEDSWELDSTIDSVETSQNFGQPMAKGGGKPMRPVNQTPSPLGHVRAY